MKTLKNWPLIVAAVVGLCAVIFCWFVPWGNLAICFTPVKVADLPGKLAPLAFAAAVIERAVEILISPWRDEWASKLQKSIDVIKSRSASPPTAQDSADLKAASDALDAYQGQTQRYAFAISITLSLLVALTGFPSIQLFINTDPHCSWLKPDFKSHQATFL